MDYKLLQNGTFLDAGAVYGDVIILSYYSGYLSLSYWLTLSYHNEILFLLSLLIIMFVILLVISPYYYTEILFWLSLPLSQLILIISIVGHLVNALQ